jgi:Fic-DOC domain mobile mystery protein B
MARVSISRDAGKTPLTPEELACLIPALTSRGDANDFETANITEASEWALSEDTLQNTDMFTEVYIRDLHRRMFDRVWTWAGKYRNTEKNIGVPVHEIRNRIPVLLGDVRYWIEHNTHDADEIAVRAHHGLVFIHPFHEGNGRQTRLFADVIAAKYGRPEFTWGFTNTEDFEQARSVYIAALQKADDGDFRDLLVCARS